MNPIKKKNLYKKQVNGKGRFGGVELELIEINKKSKVVDTCEWKDWKKYNTDFEETSFMKSIKVYILKAIEYTLHNYNSSLNFEVSLIDIQILPVDTLPSHILAATIIGLFELLNESLNPTEIKKIDDFITENNLLDFPNYKKLILGILNQKKINKNYL